MGGLGQELSNVLCFHDTWLLVARIRILVRWRGEPPKSIVWEGEVASVRVILFEVEVESGNVDWTAEGKRRGGRQKLRLARGLPL